MLYKQIQTNKRKTMLLLSFFTLIVVGVGWAIGYLVNNDSLTGIIIALVILAFYLPITYLSATSQVLSMSGAKEVTREEYPQLYAVVEELCIASRLPMPKIYVINDPSPNAFATGLKPEKGVVAFTTGLLETLNREELAGVAAHELAHIRNYDIRLMTICIALVGVIAILADFGTRMMFGRRRGNQKSHPALLIIALVFVILLPFVSRFVHLAVSRNREYLADATAVEFTRNPTGLINALEKISADPRDVKKAKSATAAMYIDRPTGRKSKKRSSWFATHPPMENRIERLQNM
ncbi:zinc metalloprotease HtpX [Ornithinibacillus sp. 4-3]|uniref:Protease HtpX homolog n=1 Tax=Ornithinibacillus sp. 4-3 TaxID=3231488 RepID=A0AB39HR02_9BACI